MAEIQITREEAGAGPAWPDLCARCGAPAQERVEVPKRRSGKIVERLHVPLCQQHLDHWAQHRRGTVLAFFVTLSAMALSAAILWSTFQLPLPGNGWKGNAGFLLVPWLIGLAIAVPWHICLGYAIHVRDGSTHWITLAGLGGKFVSAWKSRPLAIGDSPAAPTQVPRFEVFPYRPDGVCPWPGTLYVFLTAVAAGLLAGVAIGAAAIGLAALTQGWAANDLRYLVIIGGLVLLIGILLLIFCLSWRALPMAIPVLLLPGTLFLVLLAWAATLLGLPLAGSANFCLNFLPVIFVNFLVGQQTRGQKVRSAVVAGLAGVAGPLVILLGLWLSSRGAPISMEALVYLGAGALGGLALCVGYARQPFCTVCNLWMQRRLLGALSRPADLCAQVLQQGEIVRLATEAVYETADAGDIELAVYDCPGCHDKGHFVLQAHAVTKNGKKIQRRNLGMWVYPPTAWPVLQELFPSSEVESGKDNLAKEI